MTNPTSRLSASDPHSSDGTLARGRERAVGDLVPPLTPLRDVVVDPQRCGRSQIGYGGVTFSMATTTC